MVGLVDPRGALLTRSASPSEDRYYSKGPAQPSLDVVAQRECLSIVADELNFLFADKIEGSAPFTSFIDAGSPVLEVGRAIGLELSIKIQACSGLFVISENTPCETAFVTASEERLIDYIVGLVYGPSGERTPHTVDATVDMLVGRTLVEVEHRLVARTLIYYRGDRSRAAFALGIDEAALQARLRSLLVGRLPVAGARDVQQ